jgi:hypothetical protein
MIGRLIMKHWTMQPVVVVYLQIRIEPFRQDYNGIQGSIDILIFPPQKNKGPVWKTTESRLVALIDHNLRGDKNTIRIKLKAEGLTYDFFECRDAKGMP